MSHLLAELKREMNGAVVGSMRYYGAEYGLNYGVNLSTIRQMVRNDVKNHRYAKLLFLQQVRELRLASFWYAEPEAVSAEEMSFWAEGIINSEVAQEAAFVLFSKVAAVDVWLQSNDPLLQYCALLSIARRGGCSPLALRDDLIRIVQGGSNIIAQGMVALLVASPKEEVVELLTLLPEGDAATYIREEIAWRLDV